MRAYAELHYGIRSYHVVGPHLVICISRDDDVFECLEHVCR